MGWLTGWAHRKKLTIGGSVGGAQTDYLRGIRAYYGSGTDGTEVMGGVTYGKVYCESLCKTDFGDIRLTSSDGTSLLDYWMLDKTDGLDALFWVETDTPASPNIVDIYIYFGNAGATSISDSTLNPVSNPDFETDYTGWTLNLDDAKCYGNAPDTWWQETGLASMRLRTTNTGAMGNGAEITQSVNIPTTGYNLWYSAYCGYEGGGLDNNDICKATCDVGGVNFWSQNFARTTGTGEYNNQEDISAQSGSKTIKFRNERVAAGGTWYDSRNLYIDYVLVRKYVNPEPSFDSWGSMEGPQLDLYGKFEVGQDSVDLHGKFEVRQWAEDLHGKFEVRQWAEDLLGEFVVRPESSVDLKAQVNIVHWTSLPASFHVGQGSEALEGEFVVRHDQFGQLSATFEVDHITDLPAELVIRHTVPDPTKFDVYGPNALAITSPYDDCVMYPFQRKVWYVNGRHWVFYVHNYNFKYVSSTDGVTWDGPTNIRAVNTTERGRRIATWVHDDGYLHYVYSGESSGTEPRYRKGKLESDGTITWAAAEQVFSSILSGSYCYWPGICVDADGYPWVGYYYFDAVPETRIAYIITPSTNDGIWITNPNYGTRGLQLNSAESLAWSVIPVPLANGKVVAYYGGNHGTKFWARLCDGDGIGAEAEASSGGEWPQVYTGAAIALENVVIAAFGSTDLTLRVCKWENEAWGSEATIQTGLQANTCPAFSKDEGSSIVFLVWGNTISDELRYKISMDEGATWQPSGNTEYNVLISIPNGLDGLYRFSMSPETRNPAGFAWTNSSNNLEYGWIGFEEAPELFGKFDVGQDSVDLSARFDVGQGSIELLGKFESQVTAELLGKFESQVTAELFSKFEVGQGSAELPALFLIPRAYDLSSGMGISFDWWGSGGVDQNIDFEIWSLTGGWVGRFPDGPAEWRHVQLSWDDLTEVDLDGTRPDSSQIIGIYWTYHTPGVRRIDGIRPWMKQDLLCKVVIRHAGTSDLLSKFEAQATAELLGKFEAQTTAELLGKFEVPQGFNNLLAKFEVMGRIDLIAEEVLTGVENEVVFDSLDLNTHKFYRLMIDAENAEGNNHYITMYFNDDETDGNYLSSGIVKETHTYQAFPRLEYLDNGCRGKIDITITRAPDGRLMWSGTGGRQNRFVSLWSYHTQSGVHNVDNANLTKIKLIALRAGVPVTGWVAGSTFRLYGYVG